MKITKPLKLGLLHRTYSQNSVHSLVVKPLVFFNLDVPRPLVSEQEGWARLAVGMPEYQVLDEVMPKAFPEVVLAGVAHSKVPVTELEVAIKIGAVEKRLRVTGDRIWQKHWYGYRASPVAAFTSMPIDWSRAFGNKELLTNPIGLGPIVQEDPGNQVTLVGFPNVEYPNERLTRHKQAITPASFGPIHPAWAPRVNFIGDFDQSYIDHVFPDMPEDMDLRRFNLAPDDQQIPSLAGDETFQLEHLHPKFESFASKLPGVRARAFIGNVGAIQEVVLAPETVWLLPEINLGVVIYCGEAEVSGRYAQLVVDNLLMAYEHQEDPARDLAYYNDVLEQRTNTDTALAHIFDESQLSPLKSKDEQAALTQEHVDEVDRLNAYQDEHFEKVQRRYQNETGLTASSDVKPTPVNPEMVIAPAALARADFSLGPPLQSAKASMEAAETAAARDRAALPEGQTSVINESDEEIISLALSKTDGSYERESYERLRSTSEHAEQDRIDVVRLELQGAAFNQTPQAISLLKFVVAGTELRNAVRLALDSGERLSYRDFTGADLSGMDFSGKDLQGTIFECANLTNANLQGCNLQGASFLAANLCSTNLSNTVLRDANLSMAYGHDTVFRQAVFEGSVLMQNANLVGSDFTQSKISGLVSLKSRLRGCEFSESVVTQSIFTETSLAGSSFSETQITMSQFLACDFKLTEWFCPALERTVFVNSGMQLMSVEEGVFVRCQIAGDTFATGSNFTRSEFSDSGLRSLTATGISFSEARLVRTDLAMSQFRGGNFTEACFSECIANESNFSSCDFQNALISSTNLTGSLLIDSNFEGADFYESDILLADFTNAEIDQAINMMPLKKERLDDERRRVA